MNTILWEVDAQADFMLPGGKLYVPGAEKIIPNINRLVDQARQGHVLLISSADAHQLDDPEFQQWPPHCVKGTPGADLIPEAQAASQLVIPNQREFALPRDLGAYQQVILEKNTLDVFNNPNTGALLARVDVRSARSSRQAANAGGSDLQPGASTLGSPDFLVFGVVTEYCVLRAADGLLRRGFRVSIVEDAIQSLDEKKGREILDELRLRGAQLVTTDQVLALLDRSASETAEGMLRKAAGN
ncbi:MAG TPA: cysteine hydrolase family protein [Candidatus Acidoferrum sp.]|nr:cysteine hydrolase family protein [Candidatus Acidoferrum sp.]